jgi:hypothetical protein
VAQRGRVVIYENVYGQSSYVCELVHYAREPQLHVALPPCARQQRDGAQLDGDDAQRHGGALRLSDDAPAPDASVLVPSEVLRFLVIKRTEPYHASGFSKNQNPFGWPFMNPLSDCHK